MGGSIYAGGIAVEGPNVYVTGQLYGTRYFGGISLSSGATNSATYLAKLTDAGTSSTCIWAQYATQSASLIPYPFHGPAVAVLGANVYLAGQFGSAAVPRTTATFGTFSVTSAGSEDGFVAKLVDAGPAGTFTWVSSFGGTSSDAAQTVAVSGSSVYVGGNYEGAAGFGPISLTSAGGKDGFVAKLVDAGTTSSVAWATSLGGAAYDETRAVAIGSTGVYAAGEFSGTASIGSPGLTSAGGIDGFVAKLADVDGSVAWSKAVGGPAADEVVSMAVLGANVYLTGNFSGTATIGTGTLTSTGQSDIFVAKLTDAGTTGTVAWAQQAGSPDYDNGGGLSVTSTGALYVSAVSSSGPAPSVTHFGSIALANYYGATFLATMTDATISATKPADAFATWYLFPNPAHNRATIHLPALPGTPTATLTILDALGRTLRTQTAATNDQAELDLTGLAPGLYAVRVTAGAATATRRLVVE